MSYNLFPYYKKFRANICFKCYIMINYSVTSLPTYFFSTFFNYYSILSIFILYLLITRIIPSFEIVSGLNFSTVIRYLFLSWPFQFISDLQSMKIEGVLETPQELFCNCLYWPNIRFEDCAEQLQFRLQDFLSNQAFLAFLLLTYFCVYLSLNFMAESNHHRSLRFLKAVHLLAIIQW